MQFSHSVEFVCPHDCGGCLHTMDWKCGQTRANQPRILHDLDFTVLLVSALWACDKGHTRISSTDPNVLHMLYERLHFQPFVLLHKTGFTTTFINTVLELVKEGNTFDGVERILKRKRQMYVMSIALQCERILKRGSDCGDIFKQIMSCEAIQTIQNPFPSNDVFHKCFIVHYLQHRKSYNAHMESVPVSSMLSFDHTFKVSSNIYVILIKMANG